MPGFVPTPFRVHPVLRHHHLQTTWGTFFPRQQRDQAWLSAGVPREFALEDGDRLRATLHLHPDDPARVRPLVVLLHGLEGDSESHYVRGLSAKAYRLGYHSLRLSFRGCGGTAASVKKLYNGHRVEDVDHVIRELADEAPWQIVPIGVSLGANLLLRLFATYGAHPPEAVMGGVSISPPIDFFETRHAFQRGLNVGYDLFFLARLKDKLRERRPSLVGDPEALARLDEGLNARWLRGFDAAVTAPEGGFRDLDDYNQQAGTGDGLAQIRVPTLIIHAEDDPLIPMKMFNEREAMIAANPALQTIYTRHGGHVGFMEHPLKRQPERWMDEFWAENQALSYVRWLEARRAEAR